MVKVVVSAMLVILMIAIGLWLADIAADRSNHISVNSSVAAYNNRDCGYAAYEGCTTLFTLAPDSEHQVMRIRYGKDFMAIKVSSNNKSGWVVFDENMQFMLQ